MSSKQEEQKQHKSSVVSVTPMYVYNHRKHYVCVRLAFTTTRTLNVCVCGARWHDCVCALAQMRAKVVVFVASCIRFA